MATLLFITRTWIDWLKMVCKIYHAYATTSSVVLFRSSIFKFIRYHGQLEFFFGSINYTLFLIDKSIPISRELGLNRRGYIGKIM